MVLPAVCIPRLFQRIRAPRFERLAAGSLCRCGRPSSLQHLRTEWRLLKEARSSILAAAAAVADLLVIHWAQPAQLAADRLELAQVVFTLPCAYLRCANRGGGSDRKLRCGACRVAW